MDSNSSNTCLGNRDKPVFSHILAISVSRNRAIHGNQPWDSMAALGADVLRFITYFHFASLLSAVRLAQTIRIQKMKTHSYLFT
jgi:hypothetical protein